MDSNIPGNELELPMIDAQNPQQALAYELIAHTNTSFFLTGRAGTGKTTFLHNVQKMVDKQFITLASTGLASILAGGRGLQTHASPDNRVSEGLPPKQ